MGEGYFRGAFQEVFPEGADEGGSSEATLVLAQVGEYLAVCFWGESA